MNGPSYLSCYCDGPLLASECLNKEVVFVGIFANSSGWESIMEVSEFDELYSV